MVCPDTESAVHTMPAMAITKNIPVGPSRPNRSSTTDEKMIVSIVMPDTGLRATVAMALAATDAKKNENTSVSARPMQHDVQRRRQAAEEHRDRRAPTR